VEEVQQLVVLISLLSKYPVLLYFVILYWIVQSL